MKKIYIWALRSKHDTFDSNLIYSKHILVYCIWVFFMVFGSFFHFLKDNGLLKKAEAYLEPSQVSKRKFFVKNK